MVHVIPTDREPFDLHVRHLHEGWLIEGLASNASLPLTGPLKEAIGPYTIVLSKDDLKLQLFTGLEPGVEPMCIRRNEGGLIPCPPEIAHLCYRTTRYQ